MYVHVIVLPGGGYVQHAPHEAEPVVGRLNGLGWEASVFRYPLNVRQPAPLTALQAEVGRLRAEGADTIGLVGFSAGGHLAGPAAARERSRDAQGHVGRGTPLVRTGFRARPR
ncbi:alpha/beta hydrolase [Streptomyces sp. NPDC004393]|uniref:alpha/beta hydrolase n=1 Tax=Streptomyces sp. NPDC004533 TaxID=3154278 RepID=UPI0033AF6721